MKKKVFIKDIVVPKSYDAVMWYEVSYEAMEQKFETQPMLGDTFHSYAHGWFDALKYVNELLGK